MKQYIALEDVNKPQAEVVTDVQICNQYVTKLANKIFYIKHEDAVIPVVDWHDVIDFIDLSEEMESEE